MTLVVPPQPPEAKGIGQALDGEEEMINQLSIQIMIRIFSDI